jgi:hypothetical protein
VDDSHSDRQVRRSSWVADFVEGTTLDPYEIRLVLGAGGVEGDLPFDWLRTN